MNAVPLYIVANQHAVEGAQPPELWLQVIDELNAQIAADDQGDDPSQALI